MSDHFLDVTELAGDEVSQEQVNRICRRYYWAAEIGPGGDVLEVACGTGQGLGHLAAHAARVVGGDISEAMLGRARDHYGRRVPLVRLSGGDLPFPENSFDTVIMFEAIYYLPSAEGFVAECARVLRPGGRLLISTANKDLYDFQPSPYSVRYFGTVELIALLEAHGFKAACFGSTPATGQGLRQAVLRPAKRIAVGLGLIPKTMAGKKLLKRLVFGALVPMPAEIDGTMAEPEAPIPIPSDRPDRSHKVLYCAGRLPPAVV